MSISKGLGLLGFLVVLAGLVPFGEGRDYILHKIPLDGSTDSGVKGDDLVVREVVILKGATLWKIAQAHLGRGSYYPHLLAYNDIANPNLIYAGRTIHVPVSRFRDYATEGRSAGTGPSSPPAEPVRPTARETRPSLVIPEPVKKQVSPPSHTLTEKSEFDRARAQFDAGNFMEAARLFEYFADKHPGSKLRAEALFYAGEAHLMASEVR